MSRADQLLMEAHRAAKRGLSHNLVHLLDEASSFGADPAAVEQLRSFGFQNAYENSMVLTRRYADIEPRAALDHLREAQRSVPHTSHPDEHDLWVRITTNLHYLDLREARHRASNTDPNDPQDWLAYALAPITEITVRAQAHRVAPPPETAQVRESIYRSYCDLTLDRAEAHLDAYPPEHDTARSLLEDARHVMGEARLAMPERMRTLTARLEHTAHKTPYEHLRPHEPPGVRTGAPYGSGSRSP
jgi:hypothetical protein